MKYLIDDLEEYAQSDYYPFHMPGHKRKSLSFPNPYEIDITEIDGFDNLHHATGMIKEAEVRGAELYHSKRCFFLVNGSTCGLLAAISAATRRGDKVLVARNCHKAVYHALYMNCRQNICILLSQKMESRGRSQQSRCRNRYMKIRMRWQ